MDRWSEVGWVGKVGGVGRRKGRKELEGTGNVSIKSSLPFLYLPSRYRTGQDYR